MPCRQSCMILFWSAVSFTCSDNSRLRNKSVEWHSFPDSLGVCVVPWLNCKGLYGRHKVLSLFLYPLVLDTLIKTGWLMCIDLYNKYMFFVILQWKLSNKRSLDFYVLSRTLESKLETWLWIPSQLLCENVDIFLCASVSSSIQCGSNISPT